MPPSYQGTGCLGRGHFAGRKRLYHRVAGNVEKLREAAARVGQHWFRRRDREACAGVYRVA